MSLIKTHGKKHGQCNICGNIGLLTRDHVPPKGSVRVKQVEMFNMVNLLSLEKPSKKVKGRKVQSGVIYRTICEACNNTLGKSYDDEFKVLTTKTHSLLNSLSQLVLPEVVNVKIKPQKVMKAIIGHLCAVGVDRYLKGPYTEDIKEYVLNPDCPLPEYINIYYWVYPYKRQVLIRDAVYRDLRLDDPAYFWLMKFYPLSFLVVWDNPKGYVFPSLGELSIYRNFEIDDIIELPIKLRDLPHEKWPEEPTDSSFILYGEAAMGAVERENKNTLF